MTSKNSAREIMEQILNRPENKVFKLLLSIPETLNEDTLRAKLNYKKGKTIEVYIRDKHTATKGPTISKGNKLSAMNHSASVKVSINNNLEFIKISNGQADKEDLKVITDSTARHTVEDFINKNQEDLMWYWDHPEDKQGQTECLQRIIDNSGDTIKDILSGPKEIDKYLKDHKKKLKEDKKERG